MKWFLNNKRWLPFAGVALLVLVPTLMNFEILPKNNYAFLLLSIMCIYAIATSGLDILFGYTGQMSLGHAGFYAIGAYLSALMSMTSGERGFQAWFGFSIPPIVSIFVAAFVAMLFGILLALPAAKLVFHFLSLLTIAFGQLIFLAIASFPDITNSYGGLISIPMISIFGYKLSSYYSYYLFALALVVVFLIIKRNIINSRVGRGFIAIRENQWAANGCGVNVRRYKITAFAISAFYTGLAGALYAHLVTFISPESFVYAQSILFLTMLVFGGNGNLLGPIAGAVVITVVQEGLQEAMDYRMLIYGVFLLIAILFLPKGLYSFAEKLKGMIQKARGTTRVKN